MHIGYLIVWILGLPNFEATGEGRRNPYTVMGMNRTATQDEIKKAYRKLSIKLHPDRNQDPDADDRFRELTAAYQILSDPNKREAYDNYGWDGVDSLENESGGYDPFDIFAEFFGMGKRNSEGRREKKKTPAIVVPLRVTLEQVYEGDILDITYRRSVVCQAADECTLTKKDCQGPGVRLVTKQMGPGFLVQSQVADNSCVDVGKAWKSNCSACSKGIMELETTNMTVFLEPGIRPETPITYEGRGEQALFKSPGDLVLVVEALPHNRFSRDGDDLISHLDITLIDSLVGFEKPFIHINGENILIKRDEISSQGYVFVVPSKGFPIQDTEERGNLRISLNIIYPKKMILDVESKKQILEAFKLID